MEKILEKLSSNIAVEITEKFDPKEYFKDRTGLWVSSSFEERILEKAEPTEAGTRFTLDSFKFKESAYDEGIEKELPEKHILSESEVCAVVASLIEKQREGEEGVLLNDGWFNIFYTPTFVVIVGWSDTEWNVRAWGRGVYWGSGYRVFSPAIEN